MFGSGFKRKKVLASVSVSNGIAWDASNETMYYIDTAKEEVVAFDFDLISGKLGQRKVVVHFQHEKGVPDGMTIDEERMIWIAHWGGLQVSRWNPQTRE